MYWLGRSEQSLKVLVDKAFGKGIFYNLGRLEDDTVHLAVGEKVWKTDKERGIVLFDVMFYKSIHRHKTEDDYVMGIMSLIMYEAMDLFSGDIPTNQLRPVVVISIELNGKTRVHATPRAFSENPRWHSH